MSSAARDAFERIMDPATRDASGMERFAELASASGRSGRATCDALTDALARRRGRVTLIDVRSPGEFAKGHVPGAVNAPLFDDADRAAVGTVYKKVGRGEALVLGMRCATPRLEEIVRVAEEACAKSDAMASCSKDEDSDVVYVMCFRGGMRSTCVGWLLQERLEGRRVRVLDGGYKGFRRWALERCGNLPAPRVCIIGGRTGVGKTRALLALQARGEQIIDLEGLANHAGSAFGWVGRAEQPTSEHYSNLVACAWHALDPHKWVFIEDEGPHVGRCSVDPLLFERMRNAPLVLRMVATREVRLKTLVQDYATSELRADPNWLPAMRESVEKLGKRLGGDRVAAIQAELEAGEFSAVAEGLLEYYDGLYDKHLMNKRKERKNATKGASAVIGSPPIDDDASSFTSRTSERTEDEARSGAVVDVQCVADDSGALDDDAMARDILAAVDSYEHPDPYL